MFIGLSPLAAETTSPDHPYWFSHCTGFKVDEQAKSFLRSHLKAEKGVKSFEEEHKKSPDEFGLGRSIPFDVLTDSSRRKGLPWKKDQK
jgi:hypothetical protein